MIDTISIPVNLHEFGPDFTPYKGYSPKFRSHWNQEIIVLVPVPSDQVVEIVYKHEDPDAPDEITSTEYVLSLTGYQTLLNQLANAVSSAYDKRIEDMKNE